MKNFIPLLAIYFFIHILISCNSISKQNTSIDKQFLTKQEFATYITTTNDYSSSGIKFKENGTYEYNSGSEGEMIQMNTGEYEIKGEQIILTPIKCKNGGEQGNDCDCANTFKNAVCSINQDDNDLYYNQYLVIYKDKISEEKFPVKNSRVKDGEKRIFNGINVVIVNQKNVKTIKDAEIKEKPAKDAKNVEFTEIMGSNPSPLVPVGTEIEIIARTQNKEIIDGKENYWYLVNAGSWIKQTWIFGENIK